MISTLHWVPKGAAKAEPEQYELSSEDVQALQEKFSEQLRIAKSPPFAVLLAPVDNAMSLCLATHWRSPLFTI